MGHSPRRWGLALEALATIWWFKLVLKTMPFRRYRHLLEPESRTEPRPLGFERIAEVVWAVDRVSRRWAETLDCLPRALTVQRMLRRRGTSCRVRLGVAAAGAAAPTGPGIRAHAWVERDGQVLIGALPDLDAFAPLDRWPGAGT